MDPNANFLAYAHSTFGVELKPSDVWAELGLLNLDTHAPMAFLESFTKAYPKMLCARPEIHTVCGPLFFAMVRHGIEQQHYSWLERTKDIVPLWTQLGTLDISEAHADILAPLLLDHLEHGVRAQQNVYSILYFSKRLWTRMEANLPALNFEDVEHKGEEYNLFIKYKAQGAESSGLPPSMNYWLMLGWLKPIKAQLLNVENILIPLHHCAPAWTAALRWCEEPAPGQWLGLRPALSSLQLSPDDPIAWRFMSDISKNSNKDSSKQELLAAIGVANPKMQEAFASIWPAVSSLYDDNNSPKAAADHWTRSQISQEHSIALPSLSLD